MRAIFVLWICFALVFAVSCKKQYFDSGAGGRTGSAGTSPIQGALLVKQVDAWVNGDSTVTIYQYDAARLLVAEHVVGGGFDRYYYRDGLGRIVQRLWVDEGDSDIRNVVYADASSGKIAYTREISGSGASAYLDSEAYVYGANGKPVRINIYAEPALAYAQYDSFTYDAAGNLAQLVMRVTPSGRSCSTDWRSLVGRLGFPLVEATEFFLLQVEDGLILPDDLLVVFE